MKLAKLFPDLDLAVDARLADDARSVLRVIVALLMFLLVGLLQSEPSRLKALLFWSLPEVEDVAIEPTFVLLEILLLFSLLSEFFPLNLLLSGSHTDFDRIVLKFSLRLKAVGIRRTGLLFLSSSLSLDEGNELNDESTIGSTLDILSHLFKIGSLPSESLTFSNEEMIGNSIGGNLISVLVDVEFEASVSCDALLSEKLTRLSGALRAVALLCNFLIGDGFGTLSEIVLTLESLLLCLKSDSSVSTC